MSLAKTAQKIDLPGKNDLVFSPDVSLSVIDDDVLEALLGEKTEEHTHDHTHNHNDEEVHVHEDEVNEEPSEHGEVVLKIEEDEPVVKAFSLILPMVPGGDVQDEIVAEEDNHELDVEEEEEEINVAEPDMWDWQARGVKNYTAWLDQMMKNVPRHTGYDTVGIERAIAYLEALDRIVSKMVRTDLKGELDIDEIEKAREEIRKGVERLEDRHGKINVNKYKRKKKSDNDSEEGIVKEAQKIAGVKGIVVTVPLIISHIARVCINGTVSAGKDIEDTFKKLAEKYKLTDRERVETIQLISDMGYYVRHREIDFDEDFDSSSPDNAEYIQQFHA